MLKTLCMLLVTFVLAGCDIFDNPVDTETPREVGVQGRVVDAASSQPIEGAQIVIEDLGSDVTRADGRFELSVAFVPDRKYRLTCSKPGYKTFSLEVTAAEAEELQSANIALERDLQVRAIAGQVVDAETGKPLAGALVTTVPMSMRATTDSEGRYRIDQGLETGVYAVTVTAQAYAIQTVQVQVIDSTRPQQADFRLLRQQPQLLVSTHHLDAGTERQSLLLTLSSQDGTPLTFRVAVPSGERWLSADPVSGVVSDVAVPVNIRITRDRLEPGTYAGEVVVVSDGGEEHIEVEMRVPDPPQGKLSLSPARVDLGAQDERTVVELGNTGDAPLQGRIWTEEAMFSLSDTAFVLAPGASTVITLKLDRRGLATGPYEKIGFYLETGEGRRAVPVTFEVPDAPQLVFWAETLDFGSTQERLEVTVTNAGWGSGEFQVEKVPSWAEVDPMEGVVLDAEPLVIHIDRDRLPSGTHQGPLRLTYQGGQATLLLNVEVPFPETQQVSGPAEGEVIHTDHLVFVLSGGDLYRWRIDGSPWSAPAQETEISLAGLNEGPHTFEAVAVRTAGGEDATPLRTPFVVDTVEGPALWLATSAHGAPQGESIRIRLIAEEIGPLESFHVELAFDAAYLELVSTAPGTDSWADLWFPESRPGLVSLTAGRSDTGTLDPQPPAVLAQVVFRSLKAGETRIEIPQADLRASLEEKAGVEALKGIRLKIY